jgi:hypothetical protein|tara:strand:- start:478 stop:1434 length:957 start_codon:yes stop_codon:yes gene_type:complete
MITNPISNIPVNSKSHVFGWSKKWSDLLDQRIDHKCEYYNKKVYIDHGANFGGTLNLFGGANKDVFDRINRVMSAEEIISLDHEMPNYGEMLKKRIGAKTTYEGINDNWCDRLSVRCRWINSLKMEEHPNVQKGITVGDSHTIAFANKGDVIFRNDGKTLHSALKSGLGSFMRGVDATDIPVTFCFGSIDIRHHLHRHGGLSKTLIEEYVEHAYKVTNNPYFAKPVPVEFEGRRIPKSGFYKGEPFYGSREERHELTGDFITYLHDLLPEDKIVGPPVEWYRMDPEKYAKTHMELSSSFHIGPSYYRTENWGINTFLV